MSKINDWLDKYLFDDDTAIRYLEAYIKIRASQKEAMRKYYQKNKETLDAKHKQYRQSHPEYRKKKETPVLLP